MIYTACELFNRSEEHKYLLNSTYLFSPLLDVLRSFEDFYLLDGDRLLHVGGLQWQLCKISLKVTTISNIMIFKHALIKHLVYKWLG